MISQKQAIESLENIINFCEEIDIHLPDDEKTGYRMFPDYQIVRNYINESVKHGHWKKVKDLFYCSECDKLSKSGFPTENCASCGSKMDEVRNEID